jgi:hypothetical protein
MTVIEGRDDFSEFRILHDEGKKYVWTHLNKIINDPKFESLLPGLITPGASTRDQRVNSVLQNIKNIIEYCS